MFWSISRSWVKGTAILHPVLVQDEQNFVSCCPEYDVCNSALLGEGWNQLCLLLGIKIRWKSWSSEHPLTGLSDFSLEQDFTNQFLARRNYWQCTTCRLVPGKQCFMVVPCRNSGTLISGHSPNIPHLVFQIWRQTVISTVMILNTKMKQNSLYFLTTMKSHYPI